MRYNPIIWYLLAARFRKVLRGYWPEEDIRPLLRRARPIYKDLLSKVEGVSSKNPMSTNITLSFVYLAVWLRGIHSCPVPGGPQDDRHDARDTPPRADPVYGWDDVRLLDHRRQITESEVR